jgi:hypothetical protein
MDWGEGLPVQMGGSPRGRTDPGFRGELFVCPKFYFYILKGDMSIKNDGRRVAGRVEYPGGGWKKSFSLEKQNHFEV